MAHSEHLQQYLNTATIAPSIHALCPTYRALLLAISHIRPVPAFDDETSTLALERAEAFARAKQTATPIAEFPHIAAWRTAYKACGFKPNKHRNSLEALTRRAATDTGLPRVNRLTDAYNAISVLRQIPFGGEDLDKYRGSPRLMRALGTETFVTTVGGEIVEETVEVGEVVWCDDEGVTCRRWNWRQGPRTALGDGTTRALFVLDGLGGVSDAELGAAADELVEAVEAFSPGCRVARRLIGAAKGGVV